MYQNDVFLRFPGGLEKCATFSYDDSDKTNIKLVEIFNKYNLKGTFNLNAGFFEDEAAGDDRRYMKPSEVRGLFKDSPHEVAVHGHTHPFLDLLPDGVAAYEIIKDRECLEEIVQKPVVGMAYPNGPVTAEKEYNIRIRQLLRQCGIRYARRTEKAEYFRLPEDWLNMPVTCHHNDPELMDLAHAFAERKVDRIPRLFYVWGHSFEFEIQNNWDVIKNLARYLTSFEDIWFATNIEIYDYVAAYKNLRFSANGKLVYNPSATVVYIMKNQKTYEIKPNDILYIG